MVLLLLLLLPAAGADALDYGGGRGGAKQLWAGGRFRGTAAVHYGNSGGSISRGGDGGGGGGGDTTRRVVAGDLSLVGTSDGKMHAFIERTGEYLWTFAGGGPLVTTPMVHRPVLADGGGDVSAGSGNMDELYLSDPTDGGLFHVQPGQPVEKLPWTVKQLAQMSPIHTSEQDIVVGQVNSKVYALDRSTGQVLHVFEHANELYALPDEVVLPADAVLISRNYYSVSFIDLATRKERWNTTYSEYVSLKRDGRDSSLPDTQRLTDVWSTLISSGGLQHVHGLPVALYTYDVKGDMQVFKLIRESDKPSVFLGYVNKDLVALENFSSDEHLVSDTVLQLLNLADRHDRVEHHQASIPISGRTSDALGPLLLARQSSNIDGASFMFNKHHLGAPSPNATMSASNDMMNTSHHTDNIVSGNIVLLSLMATTLVILGTAYMFRIPKWWRENNKTMTEVPSEARTPSKKNKRKSNHNRNQPQSAPLRQSKGDVDVAIGGAAGTHLHEVSTLHDTLSNDLASASDVDTVAHMVASREIDSTESVFLAPQSNGWQTVAKLEISDEQLGQGSHGTFVYRGRFEGRPVAVKRLLSELYVLAEHEVNQLQNSDNHINVVRYFCRERSSDFLYIALELCAGSLSDFIALPGHSVNMEGGQRVLTMNFDGLHVEHKGNVTCISREKLLADMLSGLAHLHAMNLVHRDIKPQNILIAPTGRALISDFGLSKKLDDDQSSFRTTSFNGTIGWSAPETINSENGTTHFRATKYVDVFSAGCVIFFVLTNGMHPFGEWDVRHRNIAEGRRDLSRLERYPEAMDLVERMTHHIPLERLTIDQSLKHPFFWDAQKRLAFLLEASDRFEIEERNSPLISMLESRAFDIIGASWHSSIDPIFLENLGKYRKYQVESVRDLLRAIRNKKHHYHDLPKEVQGVLGAIPDGFLDYFCRRFPKLLLHVHSTIAQNPGCRDSMFSPYF